MNTSRLSRIAVRLIPVILATVSTACARSGSHAVEACAPLVVEQAPTPQEVGEPGWLLSGGGAKSYAVRRDEPEGKSAWLLEPVGDTYGKYGTWMRGLDAAELRGKRVRVTANVKTKDATQRVDLWVRAQGVDSPGDGRGLNSVWERLLPNSAWTQQKVVFDVPPDTRWLQYGVGVAGPGKVWLADAKVEVVGQDVPVTPGAGSAASSARTSVQDWSKVGSDVADYAVERDASVKHTGGSSALLRSLGSAPKGYAAISQSTAGMYAGKRLRFSAYVKTESVSRSAGLWMRVDLSDGRIGTLDNMRNRPINGTSEWTRYDVVLDIAPDAMDVAYGLFLEGPGKAWIDDASLEVVDSTVPTTAYRGLAAPKNLDFEQ